VTTVQHSSAPAEDHCADREKADEMRRVVLAMEDEEMGASSGTNVPRSQVVEQGRSAGLWNVVLGIIGLVIYAEVVEHLGIIAQSYLAEDRPSRQEDTVVLPKDVLGE
jgi:hypothetical protein